MTRRDEDIERAQRMVRERFGEGRIPSDELIRERRGGAAGVDRRREAAGRVPQDGNDVDWAEHNRQISESEERRAQQAALFLEFVHRNLRTQLGHRPGVMGEDEAANHMHRLVTGFYASYVLRAVQRDRGDFDEMYRLLELASLATIVAVEGYDWEGFPELEGFAGTSLPEDQAFHRTEKDTFTREEVQRAIARVRESVRGDWTRARLGDDFSGENPDEGRVPRAGAIEEGLGMFRDALLGGE